MSKVGLYRFRLGGTLPPSLLFTQQRAGAIDGWNELQDRILNRLVVLK